MDYNDLGKRIKARRTRDNLSLEQVEALTGVSDSALSDLECGKRHYLYGETLARLLAWLCDAPEGAVCYYPEKPLPEIVDDFLLLDLSISDEGALSLMTMFRGAYEAATAQQQSAQ